MNKWIDGIQLKDRWKVAPHSILEAVEDGLRAYENLNGDLVKIDERVKTHTGLSV